MFSRFAARGFTLIELLVVLVIVGTIVSMALLSVNLAGEDEDLDRERLRIASIIETAQDEAMLQGREFGVELMRSAYRLVEFDPLTRQWTDIIGDELYRLRKLPEGLEFDLLIDGRRIELEFEPQRLDDPDRPLTSSTEPYAPHLFVFASGEATVFELHLWRPATDRRLVLRGDVLGELRFGENDET
ncbi:MAG TPA: type II secretion system minor pseudopilin GspH [Woeseiaceae bacterium]|jgi:general secretion pathway protein H|nr:type II secretion system minor pseudopilin GspH [Woeseiaceae bacterium]